MNIEQIYTGCLAQGAYYIQSDGEVAIIDPLREVSSYIAKAKEDGAKIKYIFETHFHADFVSGHVTLSEKTGAPIIFGPGAKANFKIHVAKDGDVFKLGGVTIKVLHTPGHTEESSCYLLIDKKGKDYAVFSGDTLFLGDVGRPDLAQEAMNKTKEELAGMLYDSLRSKIMPLADDVIVYPGHGAGSACGKSMMQEIVDTLGHQKQVNYALRADMTRSEFIKELTDDLLPPPGYFPSNVRMNKEGYESTNDILKKGVKPLSSKEFEMIANKPNIVVLDVRTPQEFAEAHIPNSIFIGLDDNFAPWVGALLVDVTQPLVLIVPENREEEVVTRLARIGFDNTMGYLDGGIEAWQKAGKDTDSVDNISATDIYEKYQDVKDIIFDVRRNSEYLSSHIVGSKNVPLNDLNDGMDKFPQSKVFYVHCASGYRSMVAASILKSRRLYNPVNVLGGFDAIQKTDIPKTN